MKNDHKIHVEIVQDFDGSYYANVSINDELVKGLPEYVNYQTLKQAIWDKVHYKIANRKDLVFEKYGRKKYAYLNN